MRSRWLLLVALGVLTGIGSFIAHRVVRQEQLTKLASGLTGGDPTRAPQLMLTFGCAGCHDIPGLAGPSGRVGPSLRTLAERVYIGGVAANTPENLVRWIVNPKALNPR